MFRPRIVTACLLSIALPAIASSPADDETLSRRQLSALIQSAHTQAEYSRLAAYFRHEAERLSSLAAAAGEELRRELAHPTYSSKHPNAADRARRWQEFYSEQAKVMRAREQEFDLKSMASERPTPVAVTP